MTSRNHDKQAGRLADLHRASWKQALCKIVSPAVRLHHYREAHNRLLQDALQKRDCPATPDC